MLYKDGVEVRSLKFNATGTTYMDWFSQENLILSPYWKDLKDASSLKYFDILGDRPSNRSFEISQRYKSCPTSDGWMVITSSWEYCDWEKRNPLPSILYSKQNNYVTFQDGKQINSFQIIPTTLQHVHVPKLFQ